MSQELEAANQRLMGQLLDAQAERDREQQRSESLESLVKAMKEQLDMASQRTMALEERIGAVEQRPSAPQAPVALQVSVAPAVAPQAPEAPQAFQATTPEAPAKAGQAATAGRRPPREKPSPTTSGTPMTGQSPVAAAVAGQVEPSVSARKRKEDLQVPTPVEVVLDVKTSAEGNEGVLNSDEFLNSIAADTMREETDDGETDDGTNGAADEEAGHFENWSFVVQGELDDKEQPDFAHKGVTCFPASALERVAERNIACVCARGHRLDSSVPNQDDFLLAMRAPVPQGRLALYGVFDGSGPAGHNCAAFARSRLPECIFGDAEIDSKPKAVLRRAFRQTQKALLQQPFDTQTSGTTATLVLVLEVGKRPAASPASPAAPEEATPSRSSRMKQGETWAFVAHVGDSRAVLASRHDADGGSGSTSGGGSLAVTSLTRDHRPDDPDEERRVQEAGGEVRKLDGGASRVFAPGQRYPALALTRSLGVSASASCGVIPDPEVTAWRLRPNHDLLLVLGTDGLFEFCSNDDVTGHLLQRGISTEVLEEVCAESRRLWELNSYNQTVDDTTAIAISLASHFG